MKVFATLLAFATVALAATATDPFYITYPLSGTSLTAGSTARITWKNGVAGNAKVSVISGTNSAAMAVTGVSFNINGSSGEYDWTVPKSFVSTGTFAFQITYTDSTGKSANAYSGPFSIQGGTGTIGAASASATGSASASVVSVPSSAVPTASAAPSSASKAPSSAAPSAAATTVTSGAGRAVQWTVAALAVPAVIAAVYA
ncbi:hypothetical protein DM01DRAFT_1407005 [Hesseltinella vesiculosa]|uniref:Yeast cell wall synthesis Kre9/Knh1-like N-terminal domain-containing protein n=1 Tax=Hesseltinella vesiculosa TaxID=101127 RepID=A0A1X2GIV6_9FUNG|nr:hypothetical protein DM01DRAFT_1407005 [Hesseltinella vesiculosa]